MNCGNCGLTYADLERRCPACGADPLLRGKFGPVAAAPAPVQAGTFGRGPHVHGHAPASLWVDPPPAPRRAPSLLMGDVAPNAGFWLLFGGIFGGVGTVLGLVFTVVGAASGEWVFLTVGVVAGLLFGGFGWIAFGFGIREIRRTRRLWCDGGVARGTVVEAGVDRSLKVNGKSPAQIRYTYRVGGVEHTGQGQSWDPKLAQTQPGAVVAVLYDPDEPGRSVPYLVSA